MEAKSGVSGVRAVKLAGPVGRILQQGQELDCDLLRNTGEYHKDYEEAKQLCGDNLNVSVTAWGDPEVERLMNLAANSAIELIRCNSASIAAIAVAADEKGQLSRNEIEAAIQAVVTTATP